MTETQAASLRAKWKQRVDPLFCEHLDQELEVREDSYLTGSYASPRTTGVDSSASTLFFGFWLLITFLAQSSGPSYAEWLFVSGDDEAGMTVYVDPDTIRRNGDLVKMWLEQPQDHGGVWVYQIST